MVSRYIQLLKIFVVEKLNMGLYKADTCSIKETNSVVRAGYRLT